MIRDSDPNDEWDRDDSTTDMYVQELYLSRPDHDLVQEFDLETENPITVGDMIWVVVVRYDTGDTFGRNENQFKFIGAYDCKDKMVSVVDSIKDCTHPESYCWTGYFDTYLTTELHTMFVLP